MNNVELALETIGLATVIFWSAVCLIVFGSWLVSCFTRGASVRSRTITFPRR